jgi:hypothetical protein
VGYINPEYDHLAEAQRAETDPEKRAALVKQAQMVIKRDQPYVYLVYPRRSMAFNADVWDPATVSEEAGIGIRNFWTFLHAKPLDRAKGHDPQRATGDAEPQSGSHGPDRQLGHRHDLGPSRPCRHPRKPGSLGCLLSEAGSIRQRSRSCCATA